MFLQSPPRSCWAVSRHLSDTQGRCGSDAARPKITPLPSSWSLLKLSQGILVSNQTRLWPRAAFRLLFHSLSSTKLILWHLPRTLILETSSSYFSNPFIFKRQLPPSSPVLSLAYLEHLGCPSAPLGCGCFWGWHGGMGHKQTLPPGTATAAVLSQAGHSTIYPKTAPTARPALLSPSYCTHTIKTISLIHLQLQHSNNPVSKQNS